MSAAIRDALIKAGLSEPAADVKLALFERVQAGLESAGGDAASPTRLVFVPGRIELLGKHTDYAGGRSLLGTIERGVCLAAKPRPDRRVTIVDVGRDERADFSLAEHLPLVPGQWLTYPIAVARRITRNFPGTLQGASIAFTSDLPPEAGLSSSSALIVAFFLALSWINKLEKHPSYRSSVTGRAHLAGYLASIENGRGFGMLSGDSGVGTHGGSEDHTAMLCSQAGQLQEFAFCPLRHERAIAVPESMTFVIGTSGVGAVKTGPAMEPYNHAVATTSALVDVFNQTVGGKETILADAVGRRPGSADRIRAVVRETTYLPMPREVLLARLEHFIVESNELVPAAADALAAGDMAELGALVDRSQAAAETLLGNQVPETIALARSARDLGAAAATSFGAGFGGSVWALIERSQAEAFRKKWAAAFRKAFPKPARHAEFFVTPAGPPVIEI